MTQAQELRQQTLTLVQSHNTQNNPPLASLLEAWLSSLDEADLIGILPASLASVLWPAFEHAAQWMPSKGCQINTLS